MKLTPKLTPRQRAFLDNLLELYREGRAPVHYSELAKRLGVNRFSAYDMLKVLEKKGLASASYTLRSTTAAAAQPGPGRSIVVFSPTPLAVLMTAPEGDDRLGEEWQHVRERVLRILDGAREADYRQALDDLLAHLPESRAPIVFCTEMIGILLLNMQRAKTRAGGLNPIRAFASFRPGSGAGLETLAGLSVGSTLATEDEAETTLTRRLLEHVYSYQSNLSRLSGEARVALIQFLEEALEALD